MLFMRFLAKWGEAWRSPILNCDCKHQEQQAGSTDTSTSQICQHPFQEKALELYYTVLYNIIQSYGIDWNSMVWIPLVSHHRPGLLISSHQAFPDQLGQVATLLRSHLVQCRKPRNAICTFHACAVGGKVSKVLWMLASKAWKPQ